MMRGPRRNFSVANVVAATLVTVTTLVLGIYGAIEYSTISTTEWNRLRQVTQSQTNELAVALAVPVWNIDRAQIEKILDSQSQVRAIEGIVVDAAGKIHARHRDAQRRFAVSNGVFAREGLLAARQPILFNGETIGTVRLYATPKLIEEQLRSVLLRTILLILAFEALLIFFVYRVLFRAVVRPLMSIERYAVAVSEGDREESAPGVKGAAAELESLRSSIEMMVHLLALREERFRSIYDSVHDAILIIDADRVQLIDVNAGMCEMFGYTRDEAKQLRAGSLSSGMPPYTPENARSILLGASSRSRLVEWQMRHKDGHPFWVEVDVRAAIIGGERRVVTVMRDITARKEVEEALRRSERMSIMGSLVAGVAHEVRNPLFGIAAALDAFEAEFGHEKDTDEYVRVLRSDVNRLNRLMQDLLDFGRPQEAARRAQSIRPVLDEAVRVCTPRAREKQIEIRQQLGGELPQATINADRMLLVFKNVVENAIEFSPSGTAVTIAAHVEDRQSCLSLSVADRGPGFTPEDLPHLFEPFFTRRRGGSGLGLAIAQKIVSEHEGTITASNGAEGGGKIEIRLPAA
ncbi:MAG TPA: ATP-binding protein [Thermoanaerobaculia bacterium]|nr:ATP-binding protein [Thermoanaerobaculia bacterium]